MSKLFVEDTSLYAIGDAIREKTGKEDLLTLEQMPEEIKGINGGGSEGFNLTPYMLSISRGSISPNIQEITEDIVLHLEKATTLASSFMDVKFNAPKITIYISSQCTSLYRLFRDTGSTTKTIEIIGDTSNVANWFEAFSGKQTVEQIICDFDLTNATNFSTVFNSCSALKKLQLKNLSKTTNSSAAFDNCTELSELVLINCEFGFNMLLKNSAKLTNESIQNIIDSLADLTDETTQTLTLHTDTKAKLTETQIATITNKNWTLA